MYFFPSVIHGVGEIDLKDQVPEKKPGLPSSNVPDVSSLPYLLLDLRDKDAFDKCHVIGGEKSRLLTNTSLVMFCRKTVIAVNILIKTLFWWLGVCTVGNTPIPFLFYLHHYLTVSGL